MRIFITGDSRGLGQSLCEKLSLEHQVVGASRSSKNYDKWQHVQLDLNNPVISEDIGKILSETDVLIHNAAIASSNLIVTETNENLQSVFDVNFITPYILTKEWLKSRLAKKQPGHVILFQNQLRWKWVKRE